MDLYDKNNLKITSGDQLESLLLKSAKPLLEKALNAEVDEHLSYEKHGKSMDENSRNGYSEKTVKGLFGQTKISAPRDRDGSFEPIIVEKNKGFSNLKSLSKIINMAISNQAKKWNRSIKNWACVQPIINSFLA